MYNSGFTAQDPNNTGPNTGLNDLGCNLTSCWSSDPDDKDKYGRHLTETSTGSKIYYFPSRNFNSCYSGQIITLNNQTGSNINMKNDANTQVLYNGTYYTSSATWAMNSGYLAVFMLVGGGYWVQIALVAN